jgi:NAD(P)H dehydrogenase (quinone)
LRWRPHLRKKGISKVILDYDDEGTHISAFKNIDRVFMVTAYTMDMLRQSIEMLDNAKKVAVKHIVHLGANGLNDKTIGHWAWHQFVERYLEWAEFPCTHLRPQDFMQNLLAYGSKGAKNGVLHHYVADANMSWVDVDNVAEVAAVKLLHPVVHAGKTYRLGYDAKNFNEIATLITSIVGKPFRYEALSTEVFLQLMIDSGAEMAYMGCVYDHWKRYAAGTIPGADDTFDTFYEITGKQPTKWADFIEKHKSELDY